jgi:hypothetical protein
LLFIHDFQPGSILRDRNRFHAQKWAKRAKVQLLSMVVEETWPQLMMLTIRAMPTPQTYPEQAGL